MNMTGVVLPTSAGALHVYTGNGKGKTTAAVGLAVRAAGAGLRVYFAQFLKDGRSSEFRALSALGGRLECRFYGRGKFLRGKPSPADMALAQQGLADCAAAIASGEYGLVILDEACAAIATGMISVTDLLVAVGRNASAAPPPTEIVVTGRNAPAALLAVADLVTEMREIRHYAATGRKARRGIEL